jgi:RimJ/RimL family protein N-acetyltransferase
VSNIKESKIPSCSGSQSVIGKIERVEKKEKLKSQPHYTMAALNQDLKNALTSERLVYKAIEDTKDDKAFVLKVAGDPIVQSLSGASPRMPMGEKKAERLIQFFQGALLAVKICLSPAESRRFRSESKKQVAKTDDDAKEKEGEGEGEGEEEAVIPIGFIALFHRVEQSIHTAHHRNATLGMSLGEGFRGKGYGTEALNWTLDWAFYAAGLHRVQLECFSFNHNAEKTYRKVGFVEEGRQREVLYYQRGWHDFILFGMLEHEWEKLRGLK